MPIYAYRCNTCGFAKDVLQKMSDPLLTVCPTCGQPEFKKQVTAAGFQLKGSGWYVTDFKGGSGGTAKPAVGAVNTTDSGNPAPTSTTPAASSTDSNTGPAAVTAPSTPTK